MQTTDATNVESEAGATTAPVTSYSYHNLLTGEGREVEQTARPFAVVINNIKAALPHHGVSEADIVYEILAEGGITRCLAIFTDIEKVEKIGSIRSARTYFIDIARAYDAILIHAGGSNYAYEQLYSGKCNHIDGLQSGFSKGFYRDQERLDKGVSKEHTLFVSGEGILKGAEYGKYTLNRDKIDYGLQFSNNVDLTGDAAKKITLNYTKKKQTVMRYNEASGLYEGYQQGGDYIDGNTGEVICFKNVIVLKADTSSDGYRMFADLIGTGNGYFACNGEFIEIKWVRKSVKEPFAYTLADGTPIQLGIGTSYIGILPGYAEVVFE